MILVTTSEKGEETFYRTVQTVRVTAERIKFSIDGEQQVIERDESCGFDSIVLIAGTKEFSLWVSEVEKKRFG